MSMTTNGSRSTSRPPTRCPGRSGSRPASAQSATVSSVSSTAALLASPGSTSTASQAITQRDCPRQRKTHALAPIGTGTARTIVCEAVIRDAGAVARAERLIGDRATGPGGQRGINCRSEREVLGLRAGTGGEGQSADGDPRGAAQTRRIEQHLTRVLAHAATERLRNPEQMSGAAGLSIWSVLGGGCLTGQLRVVTATVNRSGMSPVQRRQVLPEGPTDSPQVRDSAASPHEAHGRNGTTRHSAARLLEWRSRLVDQRQCGGAGLTHLP